MPPTINLWTCKPEGRQRQASCKLHYVQLQRCTRVTRDNLNYACHCSSVQSQGLVKQAGSQWWCRATPATAHNAHTSHLESRHDDVMLGTCVLRSGGGGGCTLHWPSVGSSENRVLLLLRGQGVSSCSCPRAVMGFVVWCQIRSLSRGKTSWLEPKNWQCPSEASMR